MKKLLIILLSISTFAQNDLSSLKGKRIWYFGDSITMGQDIGGLNYPTYVSYYVGGITMNRAVSGTTMMKQEPINKLASDNMESLVNYNVPKFDKDKDGLIFIAFLTNDAGLFYPNYTLENYGKAIDIVINKLFELGWSVDRIKFNVRYYITDYGIDYTNINRLYVPNKATLELYNAFADLLKLKLDGYGIQYFDHWDSLSSIPDAVSYLDAIEIHPNTFMHKIIADNIIKDLYIEPKLSTSEFEINETFTDILYYNILGQIVSEPKGITIVKGRKNGLLFTKKILKR